MINEKMVRGYHYDYRAGFLSAVLLLINIAIGIHRI